MIFSVFNNLSFWLLSPSLFLLKIYLVINAYLHLIMFIIFNSFLKNIIILIFNNIKMYSYFIYYLI